MGTRSTVKFYNRRNHCLLAIYNQYDGYITGVGAEILDFFNDKEYRGNGFEDEVLMYVLFKKGGAYHTYATTESDVQEFNYEIYDTDEGIRIVIKEERWLNETEEYALVTTMHWGTLEDLKNYVLENQKREDEIMKGKQ